MMKNSDSFWSRKLGYLNQRKRDSKRLRHHSLKSCWGQGVIEYMLLLALVALVVVAGLALTGGGIGDAIGNVSKPFSGTPVATPDSSGGGESTYSVTVKPVNTEGEGIPDVPIYLFDGQGNYLDQEVRTGESGEAIFSDLANGTYAFRADYQAKEFWSEIVAVPSVNLVEIDTGEQPVSVRVANSLGNGLANVPVYAFWDNEQYTGISGTTDENGNVFVNLVNGSVKFRADYKGQPYWSETITIPEVNSVTIQVSQAPFTVKVVTRAGEAAKNVPVYAFNKDGGYTGINGRTGSDGSLTLELPDGTYKFRADYQGRDYWSDVVVSPQTNAVKIEVGLPRVTIRVVDSKGNGLAGLVVYAFYNKNKYAGISSKTDKEGVAVFELKEAEYIFRTDYKGASYWSETIAVPKVTSAKIAVNEGSVTVTVLHKRDPLQGARVYMYRLVRSGRSWHYYYLGYKVTDKDGKAAFDLTEGTYRVLAYYRDGLYSKEFKSPWKWSKRFDVPPTTEITLKLK